MRRKYALPRWVGKTMSASAPSLAITENKEGESSRLRSAIGLALTRIAFAAVMVSSMNRCKMASTGVPKQHPSTTTRESRGIAAKRSRRFALSSMLMFANPVALPPGFARLETKPDATGSATSRNTIVSMPIR